MQKQNRELRIGEILMEQGSISAAQLKEALHVQSRPQETRKLGQILLARGYVKRHHIDVALAKQRELGSGSVSGNAD